MSVSDGSLSEDHLDDIILIMLTNYVTYFTVDLVLRVYTTM